MSNSPTLVIPLSGSSARALDAVKHLLGSAEPVVLPLAGLVDRRRGALREQQYDCLALVGAPPAGEIGYSLSTLAVLVGRPRRVALIDLAEGRATVRHPVSHVARSAPFVIGQLSASLAALAGQRLAVTAAGRAPKAAVSDSLRKLVYLRPIVGSGSAVGGSVTHAHELIRALGKEGVEVDAYTTGQEIAETAAQDPDPPCEWKVVRIPWIVKAIPPSAAAGCDAVLVRAALPLARSADAIYQRHTRFSLAGALLARLSGRPLFLEYNGSQQFSSRYWNPTPLQQRVATCERAVLRAAARIFVVSEADHESLVRGGIAPDRVVLSPNGVDVQRFARGGGPEVRERYRIDDGELVIGFVGSFGPWHGAPVLAEAFARVAERDPKARLLLVGDGPELERTRSVLRAAGCESRATFTGQIRPHEVPAHLDACELLVLPHVPLPDGIEFFGSPMKLFEYMAAKKAIVASRLGQIGDVLEHRVTAWLVEPGDANELAEGLGVLAGDPDLRRTLGTNARRQAAERHSWQLNARRVTESYTTLAAERAR